MAEDPTPPHTPEWAEVRAHRRKTRPAHHLQQRPLPQPGRMLEPQDRDLHDPGRHLHPRLPLLRHPNGASSSHPIPTNPARVAESVALMKLRYVVVTSVTRDDLPDGGAAHWAATVEAIRAQNPDAVIELLIPDLDARPDLLDTVIASKPDIIGHNIETVERLTPAGPVPGQVPDQSGDPALPQQPGRRDAKRTDGSDSAKSDGEVLQTLHDLRRGGRQDRNAWSSTFGRLWSTTPLRRISLPKNSNGTDFRRWRWVSATARAHPLVRSSYMAEEALRSVKRFVAMKALLPGPRNPGVRRLLETPAGALRRPPGPETFR